MEPNCPARSKEGKGITAVNPQAETGFVCWHVFFFLVLSGKKPPPATCGRIYQHRGLGPLNDRRDGGRPAWAAYSVWLVLWGIVPVLCPVWGILMLFLSAVLILPQPLIVL